MGLMSTEENLTVNKGELKIVSNNSCDVQEKWQHNIDEKDKNPRKHLCLVLSIEKELNIQQFFCCSYWCTKLIGYCISAVEANFICEQKLILWR